MPDETSDNPNPPSEEQSTDTPTLAKRKAFKPSGETQGGDKPVGKKGKKQKPEPTTFLGKLWYGWVKPIGSVIIVVVVVRSMLIDWNDVPSGSMEPEIHVGDRIAVNRLAYALQFPLTGPTIGIPFIGPQFDNPLDGIPQIQWAEPQRGDIVTFWNPVTDVRMVKRIVAVSGDTIEIRNSVMIINGKPASYANVNAATAGLPATTTYEELDRNTGKPTTVTKPLTYQRETLLDQEKIVQHTEARWANYLLLEGPNGTKELIEGKSITRNVNVPSDFDPRITIAKKITRTIDQILEQVPPQQVIAQIADGQILIDGKEASYEALAKRLLKPFETGTVADSLSKIDVAIVDGEVLVDGEPAFNEIAMTELRQRSTTLGPVDKANVDTVRQSLSILRSSLSTNFGPYTLPDDKYFMVGDNRNNSSDSRFFGPVDRGEITGKAFAVAFSFEDNKMFALPPDPAWERFFKDLD